MLRFCLPVSRTETVFREPTGAEDVFLHEAQRADAGLALWAVSSLGRRPDGETMGWDALSISDLDAALLAVRRMLLGDRVQATVRCACNERIDIEFRVDEYLTHHAPRTPPRVASAGDEGWWRLDGGEGAFRLPTAADQLAISVHPEPLLELERRCFRPANLSKIVRRKMEAAMEALAPNLCGVLEGLCPRCKARVQVGFDPQRYVVEELRQRAAFVFEEVHLLASAYGWHERDILAMPQSRRVRYANLIQESAAGG